MNSPSQIDLSVDQSVSEILGTAPCTWMMCHSEKLAVLGLLSILKAKNVLEFGYGEGGETRWLSSCVDNVVTVDFNPDVLTAQESMKNVEAWCMTTDEASEKIKASGRKFDLTIIDAGHHSDHVRKDIENAICFSRVILTHDVYNPQTRKGFLSAVAKHDVWSDVEFIPGGKQADGMWGGLGIIVPSWPRNTSTNMTPRTKVYPILRILSIPESIRNKIFAAFSKK